MDFQIYHSLEELDPHADEWNALLAECAIHVPFLRYEYLRNWWLTLGGGEWEKAEMVVVVASEGDQWIGIAPMFLAENRQGEPALMLMGSIEISDYLDVIARQEDLLPFLNGLLNFLPKAELPVWRLLDWYNLLEDSPTIAALEQAAQDRNWSVRAEKLQHSPFIPLTGDWETYLGGIDKKQRHEIRRKLRRFESSDHSGRWYFVQDGSKLDDEARAFLDLMAQDPEKETFLSEAMRRQMISTIRCAFDAGCLQLAFLEINGEKAAGYMNFDYLNRIWVYNSGLDRRFNDYSPGWVLLAYLLQWATENQRSEFDFMRGDEEYKYRFGAVDRFVVRLTARLG